jgi:DNA-binding IclR family transcriptional regulator
MMAKTNETATAEIAVPRTTKISTVIKLLQRNDGATLAEMMEATGWQPHSTRAVLTGLKKKGHVIAKSKRDDATSYRIVGDA